MSVTEWLTFASTFFNTVLTETNFGSVISGSICAVGITQLVKTFVIRSTLPNGPRAVWYLTTAGTGWVSTLWLWPSRQAIVWGLIAGTVIAPLMYLIGTIILYKLFPSLEQHISANPGPPK